jgi:hypothetical protein
MMKILKGALALCFSVLLMPQAMACFTVYNLASNQVVYSGMEPPIDMSYQIHERLPSAFPGGHMVFGNSTDCPSVDARRVSPELTNVSIASAAVAARPARPSGAMSRAARNREQDALTK